MVMKGLVDILIILKVVLNKEVGFRIGNVLSYVVVFDVEGYDRLFFVIDVVMNLVFDINIKK